jgi:signal peptidase I
MTRTRRPAERALRHAARAFVWTAAGFSAAIALALVAPLAFDARPLTVLSGSMEPELGAGDVVLARSIPALEARPGDVVTFRAPPAMAGGGGRPLITHRVRSIEARAGKVVFVTKGDANNSVERWQIDADEDVSRATVRVPMLGHGLAFAGSQAGIVLLVLLPLLVLGVLEVGAIWRRPEKEPVGEAAA